MAEPSQITFSFKEIAEALVKIQQIHEGIWGVYVKFGIGAANMGPSPTEMRPTAIIPVLELGIQKFDQESNMTVDASKVNPKTKKK
jgi:hypothetical protein